MKKIPTIFLRDPERRACVTREPNPDCAWVFAGEGEATWKYDGTCVRLTNDGLWWARREVKPGKATPANYVPVELDEKTGKMVGWEPIEQSAFARYHAEALRETHSVISQKGWPAGTYELVGPKINGNPERVDTHCLWAHAAATVLEPVPRDFDGLVRATEPITEAPAGTDTKETEPCRTVASGRRRHPRLLPGAVPATADHPRPPGAPAAQ